MARYVTGYDRMAKRNSTSVVKSSSFGNVILSTMKNVITLIMIMWALGSLMYIAGEPVNGSQVENVVVGFLSLGLCTLAWRELDRRDWIINDRK